MTLLIGGLLALFSLAVVAYPFFRSQVQARFGDGHLDTCLATELGNIYDAIRTLQLEYQLGQIPENLYREHMREYRLQAAAALRQQVKDQVSAPEWLFEQEVLAARDVLRASGDGPIPCPSCRELPGPGLVVCPECGTELNASSSQD